MELDYRRLAAELAPHLLGQLAALRPPPSGPGYIKGTRAIARFLGVSEDTFRRRHKTRIPICGYEDYNHRGKIRIRPVCREQDLRSYRENLRPKFSPKV